LAALLLLELAHAIGRTEINGQPQFFRADINVLERSLLEESSDSQQLMLGIPLHVLVANQDKAGMLLAHKKPALNMIRPRSPLAIELSRQKTRNEFIHRILIGDISGFQIMVIERHRHIAWITNDINDLRIMGLETLVTL